MEFQCAEQEMKLAKETCNSMRDFQEWEPAPVAPLTDLTFVTEYEKNHAEPPIDAPHSHFLGGMIEIVQTYEESRCSSSEPSSPRNVYEYVLKSPKPASRVPTKRII
uniref:Uncharacterized protein n=1 Tax=Mucochytrium quahogii TaxID=96639 RepID=A0A7S2WF12_9STRA|mmetsp:Transcript_15429/g.25212  ORF Transcript_15429/g.25212 Transcript_15429/m.25212 type:complete len:107 (+) Transcript_15429:244-564(+)